jgi:hypothetical protein
MPMVCKTCSHPERKAIDKALAQGTPNRRIAAQYGLSETGVRGHKRDHLSRSLAKAAEARPLAQAENILQRLESLIADAKRIAEAAVNEGKFAAAQSGIRNVVSILELVARLTGQLGEGSTTVNIALVQQAKAEEDELVRLRRLNPDERDQLRGLLQKMEADPETIEVACAPLTPTGDAEKLE